MAVKDVNTSSQLVTFAIFAYNQRDYILDAMIGAVSQTYSPMEIIISDDSSSDGTFEIIKYFVSSYNGPHKLIANQTAANKGLIGHLFDVVDIANGKLILLAAGDDISHPQRATDTVIEWERNSAFGIFSNYELIDSDGQVIKSDFSPNGKSELAEDIFLKVGFPDIHGASSAYDVEFLRSLPRPSERYFFEDTFLTFMLYLYDKKIIKINKPLVKYRAHSESISNNFITKKSIKSIINGELKSSNYCLNKYNLYIFMNKHVSNGVHPYKVSKFNIQALSSYMSKLEAQSLWIEVGFFGRLKFLINLRSNKRFVYWLLPRIFGVKLFSFVRYSIQKIYVG